MGNYSELLKDPHWQKKRLEIFERDKWTCQLCGDKETTLHVHHKKYIKDKNPWEINNKYLITLCEDCHTEISSDEFKDIPFNKIRIYKSSGWIGGNKIIFIADIKKILVSMKIYDNNNDFIIGFNLEDDELSNIIKILKEACNG